MGRKFANFCYLVNCSNIPFGRPFVKRFVLCYWTVVCLSVCLSVLSVMLVYRGQTVEWINMPLGMEVGLHPDHTVLDGHLAPPNGHNSPPIFDPCLLWPNGWMDQDAAWYGGRPRPRPHYITWGPSSPDGKRHSSPATFQRMSKFVMQWWWLLHRTGS